MNYGQLKSMALQLIFSESIAGAPIPESYNNQADYIRAIPALANDGMMAIATSAKRIPAIVPLADLERQSLGDCSLYTLPEDCWQLMNGGLIWRGPERAQDAWQRYHGYRLYMNRRLLLPDGLPNLGTMLVEYYRYPHTLPERPADGEALDNTPETHGVLAYYVAAQLVMYDDPARYAFLRSGYETRLLRLREPVTVEYVATENVYR
ncbi:MAG: hypothetical protein K6G17_01610 [Oscillospiraceae bacterium]|nr:hypothetical protein [Oscillospiraceae bacterium]